MVLVLHVWMQGCKSSQLNLERKLYEKMSIRPVVLISLFIIRYHIVILVQFCYLYGLKPSKLSMLIWHCVQLTVQVYVLSSLMHMFYRHYKNIFCRLYSIMLITPTVLRVSDYKLLVSVFYYYHNCSFETTTIKHNSCHKLYKTHFLFDVVLSSINMCLCYF